MGTPELPAAAGRIECRIGIMPGSYAIGPIPQRLIQHPAEFYPAIAHDTGIRCAPCIIIRNKTGYHNIAKTFPAVQNTVFHSQFIADAPGIRTVPVGLAVQAKRNPDHGIPLLFEQPGSGGTVHPSAHSKPNRFQCTLPPPTVGFVTSIPENRGLAYPRRKGNRQIKIVC